MSQTKAQLIGGVGISTAEDLVVSDVVLVGTSTSTGITTQRLQVTGGAYVSGNLGVGITNPGAKLDVLGDIKLSSADAEIEFNTGGSRLKGRTNALSIHTGGGLDTETDEQVRINTTGVGIGTTNPTSKLDLFGSSTQSIVAIAASDINCSLGNYFTDTVNGSKTYTVSNVPSNRVYSFTLEVTHTTGTITWFSNLEWPGGIAPTLTTGKTHLFMFVTDNGGSRWRGSSLINYTN